MHELHSEVNSYDCRTQRFQNIQSSMLPSKIIFRVISSMKVNYLELCPIHVIYSIDLFPEILFIFRTCARKVTFQIHIYVIIIKLLS